MNKLCECGCGGQVKPFRRFISGHNFPMHDPRIAKEHGDKIRKYDDYAAHRKAYFEQYRKENLEHIRRKNRRNKTAKKVQVLTYYGKGKCACLRCGYDTLAALTVDHVNDDGYLDKRKHGRTGHQLYYYLVKVGFPEGYQTLCMNCQYVKREEYENNKTIRASQNSGRS